MAIILDGKKVSKDMELQLFERVDKLKARLGFTPIVATIVIGDDPASHTYVKMKKKDCEKIGLISDINYLPEETTTDEVIELIKQLNNNNEVCGIFLQHPAPKHIDESQCFETISPKKDIDGLTSTSLGMTAKGMNTYSSATPKGIVGLLKAYNIPLDGKNAVVVGRSDILGKPMNSLLLNENCSVTTCHSHTSEEDLKYYLKHADIVVGAVNIAEFIKPDWIKEGAVLIDAGYINNTGCIDFKSTDKNGKTNMEKSSAYTPVPGGVGPMTRAMLLKQSVESAEALSEEMMNKKLNSFKYFHSNKNTTM